MKKIRTDREVVNSLRPTMPSSKIRMSKNGKPLVSHKTAGASARWLRTKQQTDNGKSFKEIRKENKS